MPLVGRHSGKSGSELAADGAQTPYAPWHFLNFLPLPQGHGSLRPTPSNCAIAAVAAPGNAARPRLSVACTLRFGAAAGAAGGAPGNSASVGSPAPPPFASLSGRGGGGGGGPCTFTCTFRNRSAKVDWMSRSRSSNISNASFLYSTSGSFWPYAR